MTLSTDKASVSVLEPGPPHFSVVTSRTVNEGAGKITLTVTRSADTANPADIDYSFGAAGDTAHAPVDYDLGSVAPSGTLHFNAGETSETIDLTITDPHKISGTSVLTFHIANPNPHTGIIDQGTETITINDNDVVQSHFSVGDVNGNTGLSVNEAAGTVTLFVKRTGDLSQAATVQIDTADATAKAGTDYTAFSQQLTFAPGQGQASFTVDITNRHVLGNPEQFNVKLSIPSGADPLLADVSSTNGIAAVTINETAASHFSVGDTFGNPSVGVSENAGTVRLFVKRSGNLAGTATVDIQSADDTAKAGTDYTALTHQTLTFADGQDTQFVDIPIADLHKISGTEQFKVNLSVTPPNSDPLIADISQGTATVTISDNDPVQNHFSVGNATGGATLSVNEAAGTVRIFVNRTGDLSTTTTVDLQTSDGTAKSGTDYTALAKTTLTFGPGISQKFVDVPIADLHLVSGTALFSAALSLPSAQLADSADLLGPWHRDRHDQSQ